MTEHETLTKAADKLEELAKHFQGYVENFPRTTPGRFDSPTDAWRYDNIDRSADRDASKWIETMSPATAPILAAALRDAARRMELHPQLGYEGSTFQRCMVALAALIVGEYS